MAEVNEGITLGRYYDDKTREAGDKITYTGERHLMLFGANGSGKGTRFLTPNLLSITDRSIVVIDPKGELAAMTADYRRTVSDVVILNPFNVLGLGSAGFNPLAALDPKSPTFYDDAAALGEALIKPETGTNAHFSELAQGLVVALLMWDKLRNGDNANLGNVRRLLTEAETLQHYTNVDGKPAEKPVGGLRVTAAKMVADGGDIIASLAGRFTGQQTNELASVRSTADTQTRWILSPPMAEDLKKSGVDFRKLKDKRTTVYVILPAERMRTHSVWLRLVIVSALRALYRPGGLRTLLMIDELPALGHLAPLEDAFGLVRGYKVQIAGICQDLAQLKALYNERWESFLANAGVVQGFAPNDLTTADWMSRRAGQKTEIAASTSESFNPATGQRSTGTSWSEVGRPVFQPHDLMGFTEGTGLLWIGGVGMAHSIRFFAPPWWDIRLCEQRGKRSPYYEG